MKSLFYAAILLATIQVSAQSYFKNGKYNRIGIQARYALFDVSTNNIAIDGGEGFQAGLTTRGRLYNNWGVVYGIDFLSVDAMIQTNSTGTIQSNEARYNLIGAQVNLLFSYALIGQNLSIDIGPALLVNGKMKLDDSNDASNIVTGFTSLRAEELEEVSRINPFAVVALTGGFESVRFTIQYQYGFTNFFGNYNDQNFSDTQAASTNFKANTSLLSGGVVFYL